MAEQPWMPGQADQGWTEVAELRRGSCLPPPPPAATPEVPLLFGTSVSAESHMLVFL